MRRFARRTTVLIAAAALQGCGATASDDHVEPDPAIGEQRALQDARAMIDERPESAREAAEALPSAAPPSPSP